ncbi:Zinc ion binding, putative isoform 1 [Hibiscus syriacus]|uniref:Zinc ion binding, putative isoform 1 n=1 Tax=Hibiscus syriacus TaxID=106335 RepID=A0A6A3A587_HIBSY|nr:actin cytoskeleton-regulatory complex protein PAN1-like [Hibiscus syriacus]KAE8698405.1 Zinc ion binding, putative isoform 1 [Hibiscus syriacus]
MELTGEPPPLWPQLATTSMHYRRRRSPSSLFTPPVLIILLPTIALLLLFFAVPPFLSTIAGQIFRPTGVKKNSDSLNVFLVFFVILCGVFVRRNGCDGEDKYSRTDGSNNNKLSHPVQQRWFDQYPEKKIYDDHPPVNAKTLAAEPTGVRRLKRSSSSYPDLRQESLWENNEDRSRFFDDFEINRYRSSTNNYNDEAHELRQSWRNDHFEESEPKVIPCDTFVFRSSPWPPLPPMSPAPSTPPPPPSPPPPPPPPAAAYLKQRRTYQAVGQKENVMKPHIEFDESESPKPVTQPLPPPPPPRRPPSQLVQQGNRSEQRYAKLERRRSNATKEIKMVFASFRKRKKKKAKDHNHDHHHDYPLHSRRQPPPCYSTIPPPPPPPPPPMPPPPSSVFQKYNLFRSKASKSKKIPSAPLASPPPRPPPPPPPFSVPKFMQNTQILPTTPPPAPPTPPPEPSRRRTTSKANRCRPPLPTKANTSSYYEENVNSGWQSPLIPKPPPPPSFSMSELKFVFSGDFVKIRSNPSSRCSSPDIEEANVPSSMMEGNDGGVQVVCPSPDVNAKADTFIARLRDGWKLEKINSMKEKQMI